MPPTATQTLTSPAPLEAPRAPTEVSQPGHSPAPEQALGTAAVLGLGYVGLPTSLALACAGFGIVGIDVSRQRLDAITNGDADLLPRDHDRLGILIGDRRLRLTTDSRALAAADTVFICVPTPVDEHLAPDLRFVRSACAAVVLNARPGQLILLTSTSYVGTTRDLLIEPLAGRGLLAGEDVFVAFSPERIDPGNARYRQEDVPRVIGGASEPCAQRAAEVVSRIAQRAHRVSSPEAAELCKLYENSFRAVNIGFANEMADASRSLGLDPIEVTEAAATKPYGYMPFYPGAGVGGHCIPCDPHYLLEGLREVHASAPILERAMSGIAGRPAGVVQRARDLLERTGTPICEARVLVVGAAYKPGIMDTRESPAMEILHGLLELSAEIGYHDPLVRSLDLGKGLTLLSTADPEPRDWDLVIVVTTHAEQDYEWLRRCQHVLDCTYRTPGGLRRSLI